MAQGILPFNYDELVKSPENFCGAPYIVFKSYIRYNIKWLDFHIPTFYETIKYEAEKRQRG